MKNTLLTFFFIGVFANCFAQEIKSSNNIPFPFDVKYKVGGWLVAPGFTYMVPGKGANETISSGGLTKTNTATAKGKFGPYIELGRFKVIKGARRIQFFDYSASYKRFNGTEKFTSDTTNNLGQVTTLESESVYKDNIASLNLNFYNVKKLSNYDFIINSIGINGDYSFKQKLENGNLSMTNIARYKQNQINVQLHYKLGYGFKFLKEFIVVPTVETPIITAYTFDSGKSTSKYFYTRHRPLIFAVRVYWMISNLHNCPPVYL